MAEGSLTCSRLQDNSSDGFAKTLHQTLESLLLGTLSRLREKAGYSVEETLSQTLVFFSSSSDY